MISDQHESRNAAHAEKMATEEARQKYAERRHPGERPFAVIKQKFGARPFCCRGLDRVPQEWTWLTIAFNLDRILNLIPTRAGPYPLSRPVSLPPP